MAGKISHPNFLFIITDQQRADHLGCYGNRVVRTPHIDRIAASGSVFDRFYVASTVCMPNRASIMTGRYPSVHGTRTNGIPLSRHAVTFPQVLREEGYRTGLVGKAHFQNMDERPPSLPAPSVPPGLRLSPAFPEAWADNISGPNYEQERRSRWSDPGHALTLPYYGFEHVELCNHHSDDTFGDWARWARERLPGYEQLCGRSHAEADEHFAVPQAWKTRLPEEIYSTSYVAERSQAFLRRHASSGNRPFFLQCSFPDPHHPFTPPGRYWGMYEPDEIPLPPTCRSPGAGAPPTVRWLHDERTAGSAPLEGPRLFAVLPDEARRMIALTYGMVTMIDDAVGRIMETLHETGLAENTIVVFTSDHGDLMGDHGIMLKGPIHYQGLIRVPFIWHDPRRSAESRVGALGSSIDIAPSVLAAAGLAPVRGMQGRDLGPLAAGNPSGCRESLLIEEESQRAFLGFSEPVRARTLVTERHRLTLYRGVDWGELYDLATDPHEEHNLWDVPTHAALKAELMASLAYRLMDVVSETPRPTRIA
ncbi:sulfatase family protein 7 [Achromobacter xylosoxidans A8]|uniref:Sulfatase family protein 7 n=1 Tax=Achromobacter xylosoxidans (strain A8) TaxID=762376 RepID=E3HNL3_ACHXA|nr:sulfatase-like hydrolase/transferase [Achromobacter xylosoxidans]ADP17052.1 sulfatase family protein 7 [Achromobacter xylosoxidans A8]